MPHQWSETEIKKIIKSRLCSEGTEYFIQWCTGELSTWELRESFHTTHLFDTFDAALRKATVNRFPLRKYQRKLEVERIKRQNGQHSGFKDKKVSLSTPMYERGHEPSEIVACVEVSGVRFALIAYKNEQRRDFVQFEDFQKKYPCLSRTFIEERHLQQVFN